MEKVNVEVEPKRRAKTDSERKSDYKIWRKAYLTPERKAKCAEYRKNYQHKWIRCEACDRDLKYGCKYVHERSNRHKLNQLVYGLLQTELN